MSEPETSASSSVFSESEPDDSRRRSPSPEPSVKEGEAENATPPEDIDVNSTGTLYADSVDPPSADTEGLTLVWQADPGPEEIKPLLPNFE